MFCKNCGKEVDPNASICLSCGAAIEKSKIEETETPNKTFCRNCGKEVDPNASICLSCGAQINEKKVEKGTTGQKSKLVAGLLAIFIGYFGVHNFYLGYTNKGVAQILLSTIGCLLIVGPIISGVWALVEGIQILTGGIKVDANGEELKE